MPITCSLLKAQRAEAHLRGDQTLGCSNQARGGCETVPGPKPVKGKCPLMGKLALVSHREGLSGVRAGGR